LHYRESNKDPHTSTPLIRGSGRGLHQTGISLNEKEKQHDQPRRKLTQIVPLRPRFCSFLAPAKHQRLCSSFSSCSIELTEGEAPSNTQAFLCFQITQAPNMITRRINRYFALPVLQCKNGPFPMCLVGYRISITLLLAWL